MRLEYTSCEQVTNYVLFKMKTEQFNTSSIISFYHEKISSLKITVTFLIQKILMYISTCQNEKMEMILKINLLIFINLHVLYQITY